MIWSAGQRGGAKARRARTEGTGHVPYMMGPICRLDSFRSLKDPCIGCKPGHPARRMRLAAEVHSMEG